ncbi:MAG: electron transfer flavoprotein-ubiquinone oxidoreductase [Pelagibacterales bacterium]|nr:electron transfer flavoprotein-ubiquinone oxidoreductase [Pelagibacterales bacterium]OUU62062.1 MAG: electron transfer flavoprotein-ubiquinone oxidoreductase [Alphaproteobacteria bacterium TMED62]
MKYDLVIVGAGPAGLSTAIKLKQLDKENNTNHSVCIIEKGSEVGAHILSGAILDPVALNELLPNWKNLDLPVSTEVRNEKFSFLTSKNCFDIPKILLPDDTKNKGNFIISLGNLCKWLANYAEKLGVDIFPGFTAKEILYDNYEKVKGVITGEKGIDKDGKKLDTYEPAIALIGKQTIFAEGCRGHLGKKLISKFNLYRNDQFQTFALGLKELWEINNDVMSKGDIFHTIGWPLYNNAYGGSFLYKLSENLLSIGFVVGLDYKNTYLNPYEEFQKFKTHKKIKAILNKGKRISYGARALNEGGFQSLPKFSFPGGLIIGCDAGTLNVLKIKGTHNAMKSGIIAADTFYKDSIENKNSLELYEFNTKFKRSFIYKELYKSRNVRPGFNKGLFLGTLNTFIDQKILRGKAPWTLSHHKKDNNSLKDIKNSSKILYTSKKDNIFSFDRLTNVSYSGTNHKENQPNHLKLLKDTIPIEHNYNKYFSPETRYCPAGVYEIIDIENKGPTLQINFQNCLHCKTCDIKDPLQNINWTPPEGGDGPRYSNM